ncbi:hypothetical protein [Campylobacter sp. CCS1377]|uniref:Tetratricopeptide repeat-like domain-containing protein n=1 Tax=Campylobacter sp. CCS1377 TaxID=3158229 RepID=A0AAU7E8R5_9BACT|nr:hypothetical protein [Campylobacter jejuni]
MALKDDLNTIKSELSAQEQMIGNFIKGERFIRKYKYYFLALIVTLLLWFLISFIINLVKENNIKTSNELYISLIKDPNNQEKLNSLKDKNANLYAIYLLSQNSSNLQELENLKLDPLLKSIVDLELNKDSILLKEYKKLLLAYSLLEQNKIKEAQVIFSQIDPNSQIGQLANNLKHYQGQK